jgi:hypothetical protein
VDPYRVRIYSLDLPQGTYVRTFGLSVGGLGGDVTGTSVRIASPVFLLVVHGWLRSARWRMLGPCSPDGLQVPPGCLVRFSVGSPLGYIEDIRQVPWVYVYTHKDALTMIGNHILNLNPTRNENFGYVAPVKL